MAQLKPFRRVDANCSHCGAPVRRYAVDTDRYYCNTACKAEWQKTQRPVTVEWLIQKYVVEGLDTSQIGRLVNRHPKGVWFWLKGSGIPTRPRGTTGNHKHATPRRGFHLSDAQKQSLREARKASPNLPHLTGGKHWLHSTPGAKPASWKGGITPERQAFYATNEWKECVKIVWHRDDAKCHRCQMDHRLIVRGSIRFDIHHIDSFMIVERRADPANLILFCQPCHKWIHSKKNTGRLYLGEGN